MKNTIFFLFLLLNEASFASSLEELQNKKKPGRTLLITVREKGTGDFLNRVEIKSEKQVCFTNKKGSCTLKITPNAKKIELYKARYSAEVVSLESLKEKSTYTVYLYPAQPDDNVIIIKGRQRKEVSKKRISLEEAEEVAPRGDPAQITKLLPGVQQTQAFSPQIVVRGSSPNDSRYFIDGLDLPFIYHGVGGISVPPKQILKDVTFDSGGFDSQYGEATGGVIKLLTKDDIAKKRETDIILNLPIYSSIFHNQPLGKNDSISASFRYSYVDLLFKAFVPKESQQKTTVLPSFGDAHVQWLHKTKDGIQKLTFLASLDRLKLSTTSNNANETGKIDFSILTAFGALGFERKGKLSPLWSYEFSPHIIYTKVDNVIGTSTIDIEGPTYRLPFHFRKKISKDEAFRIGADLEWNSVKVSVFAPRIDNDSPFRETEDAPEVESKTTYQNGLFSLWSDIDKAFGPFILTPGLRGFYSTDIKKLGLDPRLRILYRVSKKMQLKLALGQYSKAPFAQETDKKFGNPNLTYTRSYQGVLGWEANWSAKWTTDLQIYYKKNFSVIRSDPTLRYNNKGETESKGLELFIRRNKTGRAFAWLSYSLSFNREREDKDSSWYKSKYDQTHVINLTGGYSLTGQWNIGGRANYHTGDTYTKVEKSIFNTAFAKYQPRFGERNGERLPDYYQIDLYTSYDFLFNTWKLKLRAGVEYLSFTKPAFAVNYNYDYSKEELLEGLPPIPYLEIRGTF